MNTEPIPGREMPSLAAKDISLAYGERTVVDGLSVELPLGQVTMIVGANACGKSTLLRGLARLLKPSSGSVLLDGNDIHATPAKQVARQLGLLPQSPVAPDGITVSELVGRGRYPHQGWFRTWREDDDEAVAEALQATGTLDLAERDVDELSGGQRQRVWIAMALAQQTPLLLLDEPTTFLDMAHQIEVLDLITELNRSRGTTVAIVLHELNLAARYGDHLIAMKHGAIVAQGAPSRILDADLVREVFGLEALILPDPVTGAPMVVPQGRHHSTTLAPRPGGATGLGPKKTSSHEFEGVEAMSSSSVAVRPIRSFEVKVVGIEDLGPSFKRITFGSDDLRAMGSDAEGKTLDLRIKVMIPSPGHDLPDFAALMQRPGSTWYQAWLGMDEASRGFMRTYTVRRLRAEAGEIDVDFVLHPPADGGKPGPASCWAEQARLGERMVLIGPDADAGSCSGIEFTPGTSRRLLLVGDETAVPAIAAIVESLDPQTIGHVIIEVPSAADFQNLTAPAGVAIQWIARGSRAHGAQLDAAVRAACLPGSHLGSQVEAVDLDDVDVDEVTLWETPAQQGVQPNGQLYAWIAGEAAVIRELRRYLVREVGMDRRQVAFMGYWRIGRSEAA